MSRLCHFSVSSQTGSRGPTTTTSSLSEVGGQRWPCLPTKSAISGEVVQTHHEIAKKCQCNKILYSLLTKCLLIAAVNVNVLSKGTGQFRLVGRFSSGRPVSGACRRRIPSERGCTADCTASSGHGGFPSRTSRDIKVLKSQLLVISALFYTQVSYRSPGCLNTTLKRTKEPQGLVENLK